MDCISLRLSYIILDNCCWFSFCCAWDDLLLQKIPGDDVFLLFTTITDKGVLFIFVYVCICYQKGDRVMDLKMISLMVMLNNHINLSFKYIWNIIMSHCYRIIINRNKTVDNINYECTRFYFLQKYLFSKIQGGHQTSWHQNQNNQGLIFYLVLYGCWTPFLILMHHPPQLETFSILLSSNL